MEISVIVSNYMESIGGLCCPICNEWDHSSRFLYGICGECNKEVEEVLEEAEDF
jgi:hypothetical protein|tara:strand:- start:172 stop:333 length:162 start_codon:yes stop_codon:yes gene_type:complete